MPEYRVTIDTDGVNDHESPRTWDSNLGVMVTRMKRHVLPFESDIATEVDEHLQEHDVEKTAEWLKRAHGATVVLPVRFYAHGETRLSTQDGYPFNDSWDSGLAGVIFDTPASRKDYGLSEEASEAHIAELLSEEVRRYDIWANNEVLSFIVEKRQGVEQEWETVEETGGFYSDDDAWDYVLNLGLGLKKTDQIQAIEG